MNDILIGNGVTSTQEFRVSSGTLTNPTAVTVTVREPDATKTVYTYPTDPEVVRDSTGIYHISIVPDAVGRWGFYWLGTGTVPRATEEFINVVSSKVTL